MKDYKQIISKRSIQVWYRDDNSVVRIISQNTLTASKIVAKLLYNNVIPSIESIIISNEPHSTVVVMVRGNQIPKFLREGSCAGKIEGQKKFSSFLEKTGEI